MASNRWDSADPEVVEAKRRETSEMLALIAAAVGDGAFREFTFTAREEDQTVHGLGRPPRRRRRIMVRFEMEMDAAKFADEVRRRSEQLQAFIESDRVRLLGGGGA